MNENLEMVKKLVDETGVSYAEAKAALEKTDWDLLDAIIELESQGKSTGPARYNTRDGAAEEEESRRKKEEAKKKREEYKKNTVSVLAWLRDLFDKGNRNDIEMYRGGEKVLGMPVNLFILLCLISSGVPLILMLIALFFGCSFRFSGPDLGKDEVNKAMGKATDYAENLKKDIKDSVEM